jgi:hypothetical protein
MWCDRQNRSKWRLGNKIEMWNSLSNTLARVWRENDVVGCDLGERELFVSNVKQTCCHIWERNWQFEANIDVSM